MNVYLFFDRMRNSVYLFAAENDYEAVKATRKGEMGFEGEMVFYEEDLLKVTKVFDSKGRDFEIKVVPSR